MKGLDDFPLDQWPLGQFSGNLDQLQGIQRDPPGLQPWAISRNDKYRVPPIVKSHSTTCKTDRQKNDDQKLTNQFLSSVRNYKKAPKLENFSEDIKDALNARAPKEFSPNRTEPIEIDSFEQLGNKVCDSQQQSRNYVPKTQLNAINTTLYRCFDNHQIKLQIFPTQGPSHRDQAQKNANLQKILRMRERIRKKNHSNVQKIKLGRDPYSSVPHSKPKTNDKNSLRTLEIKTSRSPNKDRGKDRGNRISFSQTTKSNPFYTLYIPKDNQIPRAAFFSPGLHRQLQADIMQRTLYF